MTTSMSSGRHLDAGVNPLEDAQSGGDRASTSASTTNTKHAAMFPAVRQLEKGSQRIDTGQQFLEWLHQIENSLQYEDDAPYRNYIEQLEQNRADTETLLEQVTDTFVYKS